MRKVNMAAMIVCGFGALMGGTATAQKRCDLAQVEKGELTVSESLACITSVFQARADEIEKIAKKNAVPIGVVAASTVRCPDLTPGRWRQYEPANGRMIVGVGGTTDSRGETRSFSSGDTDGSFKHQLKSGEVAAHDHRLVFDSEGLHYHADRGTPVATDVGPGHEAGHVTVGDNFKTQPNSPANSAHNNMPPYTTLYLCKKEAG